MENHELKTYYEEGFYVGPTETEKKFLQRVQKTHDLLEDPTPLNKLLKVSQRIHHKNILCFQKATVPWLGGITYILELEKGIEIPVVTLSKKQFPWLSQEEILCHEEVHAKRCAFSEERFEEILAYQTSSTSWRRFLGPLFSKTKDIVCVYCFLSFVLLSSSFFPSCYLVSLAGSFGCFGYYFFKLLYRRSILDKAYQTVKTLYKNPRNMLFILTDNDISLFARGLHPSKNSLRWRQILAVFERI